jgi:iron complex outermembrane recepter protein
MHLRQPPGPAPGAGITGRLLPVVWAALASAGCPGVYAAGDSQQADASASAGAALQEVVVHARRREERLEDIPLAVSVRSGEQLREQAAVLFEDAGRDVPNVRMISSPQSVSALDITIRGQTVNRSAIVFDPAVGLYIDGVYVANGQGAMGTLLDIDSLEIARGSQGTLFGRNNTGGSILISTHRPELGRASAEVALGAGNWGQFMDRAVVNLPLGDELAVRFAYQGNEHSGFGSSISSGQNNLENQHRYQARFGALWKPADATEVYFTYERFDATEAGAILHPLAGPPPGTLIAQIGGALAQFPIPGLPTVAFPTDPYQTDGSFPAFDNARTDSLQLTATHKLEGDVALKLILGYRHLDARTALDVDASTLPLADSTLFNTSNQKSAELQLNDKSLNGRLDWVTGLYWFRDNGGAPSVLAPASPQFLGALQQVNLASGGTVNFAPFFSPLPVYEQNSVTNSSLAAYAHGEYELTPAWSAAAGVRRTEDRRELEENSFIVIPGLGQNCTILDASTQPPSPISGPCPPIDKSVSFGFWSWEVSSRYRLSPELNTYVRVGRSQRSGGWNAPVATLQDEPFRPEQLTDYEAGLKADLLGGALMVNGDVFYGKYDDMQRLLARLIGGTPATLVINAGRARISGAELEAAEHLGGGWSFQESFGWTEARYESFQYTPIAQLPGLDLSNNAFSQTPRYQASVGGAYQVPTPAGDLSLRADYAWQDKIQFNIINDFNNQGAYGTANARVALASHARSWELAVFGNNVTDKRYAYTGGTILAFTPGPPPAPFPTIAWQIPGARRLVGVEGTYRWNPAL